MGYDSIVYIRYHFSCGLTEKMRAGFRSPPSQVFRMNRKQREKSSFWQDNYLHQNDSIFRKKITFEKVSKNQDVECFWRERTHGNEEYLQKGNYTKMSHYKTANIFHIEGFWTNIVLETLNPKKFLLERRPKGKGAPRLLKRTCKRF